MVTVVIAAAMLTACGSLKPPASSPSSIEQLRGPWRPTPLRLGSDLRAELDTACRKATQMPATLSLVVVDARGASRVVLQYAAANGSQADCEGTIDGEWLSYGWRPRHPHEVGGPLANRELRIAAQARPVFDPVHAGPDQYLYMTGQAGADIHQVVAEVHGAPRIVATMADGWFALWAPAPPDGRIRLLGLDDDGAKLAELDFP